MSSTESRRRLDAAGEAGMTVLAAVAAAGRGRGPLDLSAVEQPPDYRPGDLYRAAGLISLGSAAVRRVSQARTPRRREHRPASRRRAAASSRTSSSDPGDDGPPPAPPRVALVARSRRPTLTFRLADRREASR